jgi:cytochrome c-type biogenesis protein CcmH
VIWLLFAAAAGVCLLPLTVLLRRRRYQLRGRREAALALYRAQLAELARERGDGRIGPEEYTAAEIEVQRRLLAAAAEPESSAERARRRPLLIVLALIPLAALALYWPGGTPFLPAAPLAPRLAAAAKEETLIDALRARLATMDPASPRARQGFILLGDAEKNRGNLAAAAEAWQRALAAGFDPTLAAETAETMSEAAGRVTPEAAALFRQALAAAPADAPWREAVQQRLSLANP